jgi:DUF971 family protein
MNVAAYYITDIKQTDNFTFTITWNDGFTHAYRLSDLQKKCPCAGCQERSQSRTVKEDVKTVRIMSVGSYGLRFEFTSGCKTGIYSYDLLRSFVNSSKQATSLTPSVDHE